MQVSWSGELPCARLFGLDRVRMRERITGAPRHIGWVPTSLGKLEARLLAASAIPALEQDHAVIAGEEWHHYARPQLGAWVVAIERSAGAPVWWSGPQGEQLWREITDLVGEALEQVFMAARNR